MRNLYTTIAILLLCALPALAQETTTMTVGYCGDTSDNAIGLYEKDINVSAVEFSGDFLSQYAGNKVKSIVFQLGASFGEAGSIFITDDLTSPLPDAYPIEFPISDFDTAPCYQWLEAPLPEPLVISPDHPFYVGIRILPYTTGRYYGTWQFAVENNAAAASHSFLYDIGKGKWAHTTDYTFEGVAAPNHLIKLCLEGSSLPTNDVKIADLQTIEYMRTTESCSCTFSITNLASNDINNYDAELLLDGSVAQTQHIELDSPLKTDATTMCSFTGISFSSEGTHTIVVRVKSINGVADVNPENNTLEREISVIDTYYDHHVLVEAFTTMSCANCPGAHERQEEAFKGVEGVIQVDHHSGFGTDILTHSVDRDFLWFYNNGGITYAPGMMFDRAMIDDFFDPQRSPGEEHSPIVGPGDPENILFIYNHLAGIPSYVDVNIDADYNAATRRLNITVSGEAIARLKGANPTINVWITESGLSAADDRRLGQMTGSGNLDMNFVHNYVLRSSLTGSWGKSVDLGIAPYSYTFSTTLDQGQRPENMEIVAFIGNYDNQRPDNCFIHNSATLPISQLLGADIDGTTAIPTTTKRTAPAYDLSGRTVSGKAKGIIVIGGKKFVR